MDEKKLSYLEINDAIIECLESGSRMRAKGIAECINRKYKTEMDGRSIECNLNDLYKWEIIEKQKRGQTYIYRFINSFFDKIADEAEKFIEGVGKSEDDKEDMMSLIKS